MGHFFLPSKIKVLNFIKRKSWKPASKSPRLFSIFVVSFQVKAQQTIPLNLKTLKLLRIPRQKHSQLPSTLVCLLTLHKQWKKMVSRWSLLIQTPLSGEIRSWRRPPSPWLVRRATRRIIILYLNITNTSKCFPQYVIFHAITRTRFFIYWSAYLFFNSTILQLGLQNPPDTLRFPSETIRDMLPNWNTYNKSLLQPDQHRRAFIDSALNWQVFHCTKRTLWLFAIEEFCHSLLFDIWAYW